MIVKQVIIIRKDLKMRRGKEIAQGAHASMMFLLDRVGTINHDDYPPHVWEWLRGEYRKVVCSVESEEELETLYRQAQEAGLEAHLVKDLGITEFHGTETVTALAIGPDYADKIDPITKNLRLY